MDYSIYLRGTMSLLECSCESSQPRGLHCVLSLAVPQQTTGEGEGILPVMPLSDGQFLAHLGSAHPFK